MKKRETLVNKIASMFKGSEYRIDTRIPARSLVAYLFERFLALARCLLRGVVLSIDPRDLSFLAPNVILKNRNMIHFGKGVSIGRGTIIDGLSEEGVLIGDHVSIGSYCILRATSVISDIGKRIKIGDRSGIDAFVFIGAAGGVTIGNDVIIGQRVSFHSENHIFNRIDIPIRHQGTTRQGIVIEDDCWIGSNVTFLDGSYVGKGSVIAAGAVVKGSIPSYSVAAGIPAQVIKRRSSSGLKKK